MGGAEAGCGEGPGGGAKAYHTHRRPQARAVRRDRFLLADDSVLIRVSQSELGQGMLTSNPMMICEELERDWSKMQSVYAEPNQLSSIERIC